MSTTTSTSAADLAATEAALRHDFTRAHNLRMIAPHAESPEQARVFLDQAAALAAHWTRDPESNGLWHELEAAVGAWDARPQSTATAFRRLSQAHAAGDLPIDDRRWRTLTQAAELTGHHDPTTTGSGQDSARWRPEPGIELHSSTASLLDRALGGRAPEPVSLDEVDAVIAETDRLLELEHEVGDRDTGADEHASLLPPELRAAPAADAEGRRTAALGQLQNLTAEHQRLAGEWDGPPVEVDTLVTRLDSLLEAARTARRDAAEAGASATDIEAAYHAGRDGHYWQPDHHAPAAHGDDTQPGPSAVVADADGATIHALLTAAVSSDAEPQAWTGEDSSGTAPETNTTTTEVEATL
ncbi:hypothetical protein FEK35_17480 [Nocardia cyriacigeorgica]|uniref:Uncharacterized protein n=1 Tax=Nocardia cyriacigeorgica TaxID=135487 RepID=A0A5R8PBV2_9NOCA|nr:hypothetical protein [Nocardia cyriacigeorgica]TLG08729.1 hypothetical protein FEK35_17480 [Nocardia cyriacigeorgica]